MYRDDKGKFISKEEWSQMQEVNEKVMPWINDRDEDKTKYNKVWCLLFVSVISSALILGMVYPI